MQGWLGPAPDPGKAMASDPFVSFADRVVAHAASHSGKRALVCDGLALDYRDLVLRARRCAAGLKRQGLKAAGEGRVAIVSANSLDFVVAVTACQFLGVAVVPLPGMITADALARMIEDANVSLIFSDTGHRAKIESAVQQLERAESPLIVGIGASPNSPAGTTSLDAWLPDDDVDFDLQKLAPEWASDLIYSSGTTGIPKGIVQSYGGRTAQNVSLTSLGAGPDMHFMHTVSLYSNFGMAGLYLTLWHGATFFMMSKFSGAMAVDTLAGEPIDMAWFAPATLVRTMEVPGFREAVAGRVCTKLCAGAPLSVEQKRAVLATWSGPFFDLYGQTETGTLTLLPMHAVPESKLGSVGAILPTVQVRIIDDDGNVLPPDTEGEIAGHSTTLMSGYHAREEANAKAYWHDEIGRRYIRTGDVGKVDSDGFLWLCDRKKDMIISGGYNIYPADIERILVGHSAVFEAAVVGYPSKKWGETPVAFVTLRDPSADETKLKDWVNSRVSPVQRVAAIKVLNELPSGTMGKILKRELRDRYAAEFVTLP